MRLSRACATLLALGTAFFSLSAQASGLFDSDKDQDRQPWKEDEVQLPAPPHMDKLLPLYVSATATQTFGVDPASISIGKDKVVRYTLAATSASGVKNVSYEGIRCDSRTWKPYAYGGQNGAWTRAQHGEWRPIEENAANRQQAALAKDYFCIGSEPAGTAQQLAAKLHDYRAMVTQ